MKCPECEYDQKVKYGLVCRCGYRFTFNPKELSSRGLTDGKFTAAIRKASQNGTSVFTDNQLYAAYAGKTKVSRVPAYVFAAILMVVGVVGMLNSGNILFGIPMLVALGIATHALFKRNAMSREQFEACLKKWKKSGKKIDGLLESPSLEAPPQEWPEEDIYDYGVERVLIVQRDILVDLFVRNNQHTEHRMVVISESGYPSYLRARVNQLVEERRDLPIFLLHDADASGRTMEQRARSLPWLNLADNPVIDLGFFPSDFEKLKRTSNYQTDTPGRALPADALLIGSLGTGLAACFVSQTAFGDQLLRENQNAANANSSFG